MKNYLSPAIVNVKPYVPGEQPKDGVYIKLNTNENPYPPSPKVIVAIENAASSLRLYPDPESEELRLAVADFYSIDKDMVFAGNGSDEILALCFMAFFMKEKPVLFPDISYSFYEVYAKLFGIDFKLIPLNDDYTVPVEKFTIPNDGIIIANPNAPTGIALSADNIKKILENNRESVVLVDEAYIDFGGQSMVPYISEYPNLIITQTVSKSRSLAGLRVGVAIGGVHLIDGINRVKNSFNSYPLDRLAASGAVEAFRDVEYFRSTTQKVINTRERIKNDLIHMGFNVTDSKSNFLFISHPVVAAKKIFFDLRKKKILVRYFDKERIDNHLRITIGTDSEMDALLNAIKEVLDGT